MDGRDLKPKNIFRLRRPPQIRTRTLFTRPRHNIVRNPLKNVDNNKHTSYPNLQNDFGELKILETYDDVLDLGLLESFLGHGFESDDKSSEFYNLKQVFLGSNSYPIGLVRSQDDVGIDDFNTKAAIIARRIVHHTQLKVEPIRAYQGSLSKESINTKSLFHNNSLKSFATSNGFTLISQIAPEIGQRKRKKLKTAFSRVADKAVQHVPFPRVDECTNTDAFYPSCEQFNQILENITNGDLLCMEWIDKNLFQIPFNPQAILVTEKAKDISEYACKSGLYEQELAWESKALCL